VTWAEAYSKRELSGLCHSRHSTKLLGRGRLIMYMVKAPYHWQGHLFMAEPTAETLGHPIPSPDDKS
jgi:hypothetical protein